MLSAILLITYCGFLIKDAWYAVSGSDSCGYASLAQSIVAGKVVKPAAELNHFGLDPDFTNVFTPLGYNPGPRPGTITPLYPIGLPLHLAIGGLIGGWERGPYLVNPIIAVLSLVLIYLVGMELGLSRSFSITGTILLAAHPTFIYFMLQPMSDGTATFWSLVVIWTSLRARKRDQWSVFAGAAFGVAFLVRPSDVLLLIPVLFCLPLKPRTLLLFCLGGLPVAGVFFAYNAISYGHPLKTGYTTTNHQELLSLSNILVRFNHYIKWLKKLASPLIFYAWLGVVICRRVFWRDRALIISWLGVFLIFYSFYDIYNEWWYTRFLLPGIPAMILGALLTTRELLTLLKQRLSEPILVKVGWIAIIGLIIISLNSSIRHIRRFEMFEVGRHELIYPESCRWADKILPNRSLIVSMQMSSTLKFYTDRLIARYDLVLPEQRQPLKSHVADKGYRWYALLWFWEVEKAQQGLPGKWEKIGTYQDKISLWQIEPEP